MKTLSLAAGAILLAGCAAAPNSTVTVTAPAPAPSTVTAPAPAPAPDFESQSDGEQIRELLDSRGYPYYGPPSDLEELAVSVCEAIDSGISPELLVEVAMDNGFSMEEGAALVAASIVVVCPYNSDSV